VRVDNEIKMAASVPNDVWLRNPRGLQRNIVPVIG
jgi:hypothetical protein